MMKKQRNNLKHENIVKYCKNVVNETEINTTWDKAVDHCWACGSSEYGKLERCHIIPECLGGEMKESNIVLLCNFCHFHNPETIYEEEFWKWIRGRALCGKNTILTSDDPLKCGKEYELIYGVSLTEMTNDIIPENLMKEFLNDFLIFFANSNKEFFMRNGSTTAIAMNKFLREVWKSKNFLNNSDEENSNNSDEENILNLLPPLPSLETLWKEK